jgi:hypothetical protein
MTAESASKTADDLHVSISVDVSAGEPAVVVKGEFTWDLAAPATLMDMDVSVPAGSFVAIVGPTGGCTAHPGQPLCML